MDAMTTNFILEIRASAFLTDDPRELVVPAVFYSPGYNQKFKNRHFQAFVCKCADTGRSTSGQKR